MVPPVLEARRNLLSILPRILASLASLWKAINVSEARYRRDNKDQPWWTLGSPKVEIPELLTQNSPAYLLLISSSPQLYKS